MSDDLEVCGVLFDVASDTQAVIRYGNRDEQARCIRYSRICFDVRGVAVDQVIEQGEAPPLPFPPVIRRQLR